MGFLLRIPNKNNPLVLEEVIKQEKMLEVFKEYLHWLDIMELSNVGDFNVACKRDLQQILSMCPKLCRRKRFRI